MTTHEMFEQLRKELAEIRSILTEQADEILDIEGVRELTGLSKSAIYQKTCTRFDAPPELPHYRRGKRLYFKRSEIVVWLTAHPVRSRAAIDAAAARYVATHRSRRG